MEINSILIWVHPKENQRMWWPNCWQIRWYHW